MTKKRQKSVDKVMGQLHEAGDAFAARVHPLYVALDWKWGALAGAQHGQGRVPTVDDINGTLFMLLAMVERQLRAGKDSADASTGGLTVRVEPRNGEPAVGHIEFTVRKTAYAS